MQQKQKTALLLGSLVVVGLAALLPTYFRAPKSEPSPPPKMTEDASYATVRVLFATDRNHNPGAAPAALFGTARAPLSYGTCDVSIPRDHRMGQLESPSLFRLEFRQDPEKHIVLLRAEVLAKDGFLRTLAERTLASRRRTAFLFVHGYNVTFEDAARRTAQIAYDLAFDGAPVFYSWPSQGSEPAYIVDEQNIEWAQANLQKFLTDFFENSHAEHVYLIAHSMGNRALTRALAAVLAERPEFRPRLEEIILAAPDIDAEVFKRDIAPRLTAAGRPVTLYASSEDFALSLSKRAHGYPRAGDAGPGLVILPGIETIDATGVDTSFLAHSYFAETTSILGDMFYLIKQGVRARERFGLVPVQSPAGLYWKVRRQ